jgi:hypothetical protein
MRKDSGNSSKPPSSIMFWNYWIKHTLPQNQTFIIRATTILCICSVFEKRIPFLTNRAHHVLNDSCFRSIFCVFFFVTTKTSVEKRSYYA